MEYLKKNWLLVVIAIVLIAIWISLNDLKGDIALIRFYTSYLTEL
jgi:hypothetical protein